MISDAVRFMGVRAAQRGCGERRVLERTCPVCRLNEYLRPLEAHPLPLGPTVLTLLQ